MIFGNSNERSRLAQVSLPTSPDQTIILAGPAHTGKAHAILELVKAVSADDVLVADSGIESARDATDFCRSEPISSDLRYLCLPDLDKFTESAQDAYLKLTEEPSARCKIIASSSNFDGILPALRSRFRTRIFWGRLSSDEMREFAASEGVVDESALALSDGHSGVYFKLAHNSKYMEFERTLHKLKENEQGILFSTPEIISKLDSKAEDRFVIVHLIRRVARVFPASKARFMFSYAALLESLPSANADIHWSRMILGMASV